MRWPNRRMVGSPASPDGRPAEEVEDLWLGERRGHRQGRLPRGTWRQVSQLAASSPAHARILLKVDASADGPARAFSRGRWAAGRRRG
jgi:hypothetical protein